MTESGSLQDSWWMNDPVYLGAAAPADAANPLARCQQLKLDLQGLATGSEPDPDWQGGATGRLGPPTAGAERPSSPLREQAERIQQLEKALDQSLASLEDLRRQLIDQQFLEAQLASTEEISNIQQQAITQLKWQLGQQQQTLAAQHQLNQAQNQRFQELLESLEAPAEGKQQQIEQIKAQFLCDRQLAQAQIEAVQQLQRPQPTPIAPPHLAHGWTAEQRTATPAHGTPEAHSAHGADLQHLQQSLQARQAEIEQLELELERAHEALQVQQAQIDLLQQAHTARQSLNESPLDGELFTAHSKIQELETHLSRQMTNQAMLQHTCQELEQARDRYQIRITELEQQTAEMQEQILKQAQQASEYETAVQHWKDRYTQTQADLGHLKELIERALTEPTPEIVEVLAQLQAMTDLAETEAGTIPVAKGIKKDVPDFLMRRQRYRVRH